MAYPLPPAPPPRHPACFARVTAHRMQRGRGAHNTHIRTCTALLVDPQEGLQLQHVAVLQAAGVVAVCYAAGHGGHAPAPMLMTRLLRHVQCHASRGAMGCAAVVRWEGR